MTWQPIETAPKGDDRLTLLQSRLLTADSYPDNVRIAFWSERGAHHDSSCGFWADWGKGLENSDPEEWDEIIDPTHWMPMPPR